MTVKSKLVNTKKKHRCFSCERVFPENTKMHYWVGTIEGDFCASYCCDTCNQIMKLDPFPSDGYYPEGYVLNSLDKNQTPEEYLSTQYLQSKNQKL